ncbi:MAG: M81 family metallopeptidase [Gammaproteobacteria bacterium]|nr:M81 family metallopeptidase [Gammaproteobacteria bacterium]
MAKIAVGGWQHETNTFSPVKADYHSFERADEWPPLSRGNSMFDTVHGVHLPINRAIETLKERGHTLAPLLWCSATPCAHVTQRAFDTILSMLLDELQSVLPVDGIYLDLHGAMVCEHSQDGEGEILRSIREIVGRDIPIAVSLDLHANVTQQMVDHATVLDLFRTYPHVDMGETGARTAHHLNTLLRNGEEWKKAYRQTDFLIPLNWGCTLIEPAKSLYDYLPSLINDDTPAVSFACGFHLSDIHDVGPSVVAYGKTQQAADDVADAMLSAINAKESRFGGKIWPADEAVTEAQRIISTKDGPVVLADTQDNPGGGGSGDTTGLLQSLLNMNVESTLFGTLNDAQTATKAHQLGIGERFDAQLGEHSGLVGHKPLHANTKVVALSDGSFTATGPMYKGARMTLGPCALLEIDDVQVLVSSHAVQTADQSIFKHIGIDPEGKSVIALKSSVHFRNDFEAMASDILIVAAPGVVYADPSQLIYKNIRPGIHVRPRQVNNKK